MNEIQSGGKEIEKKNGLHNLFGGLKVANILSNDKKKVQNPDHLMPKDEHNQNITAIVIVAHSVDATAADDDDDISSILVFVWRTKTFNTRFEMKTKKKRKFFFSFPELRFLYFILFFSVSPLSIEAE